MTIRRYRPEDDKFWLKKDAPDSGFPPEPSLQWLANEEKSFDAHPNGECGANRRRELFIYIDKLRAYAGQQRQRANRAIQLYELTLANETKWMRKHTEVEQRLADAELDARRYRWLRTDRKHLSDGNPFIAITHEGGAGYSGWTDEHADAVIDEAISNDKAGD